MAAVEKGCRRAGVRTRDGKVSYNGEEVKTA